MAKREVTTIEAAAETWTLITVAVGGYQVSNLGNVKSFQYRRKFPNGFLMKLTPDKDGYLQVGLPTGTKQKKFKVHQLVALYFIGPCPPDHEVNHKDGNKANNRDGNLEYKTHAQNVVHAKDSGLLPTGGRHYSHTHPERVSRGETLSQKLTEPEVLAIRAEHIPDVFGYIRLAKKYGVCFQLIAQIITRKIWTHI